MLGLTQDTRSTNMCSETEIEFIARREKILMNRTPPKAVRQHLRREIGFGCPVPGCANPYLEWHHYDPPWHEREHHEPQGMIALCAEHHRKADAGAFTVDQLRMFKADAIAKAKEIQGRFDWLRHRLLAVVGSNFYYETPIIFQFRDQPIVWFNRDSEQHLLLNVRMLTTSGEERLVLEDNDWVARGTLSDFECPPSGRLVDARYANGDAIRIEYFEIDSIEAIQQRYPEAHAVHWQIELPITCVEVHFKVAGTLIEFGPTYTRLPGNNIIRWGFVSHCGAGIVLR